MAIKMFLKASRNLKMTFTTTTTNAKTNKKKFQVRKTWRSTRATQATVKERRNSRSSSQVDNLVNMIWFDQIFTKLYIFSLRVFERVFEPLSFTSSLLVRSRQTRSIAVLSSIVVKSPTTKTGPKIFASPLPFSRSLVVAVCRKFSIQ